jgi:hypothetical protein
MKKLLALAASFAIASSASAASLSWGPGSGALFLFKPGETTAKMAGDFVDDGGTIPDGAKFVLVYLGQSTSLDVSTITDAMVKDSIAFGYSVDTWGDSTASTDARSITVLESDGYSAGDSFAVAWFDGSSYKDIYDIESYDTGVVGGAISAVVTIDNGFAANQRYSVAATSQSSDTAYAVAVPEPATAMLAIAGLALLLKRRKA